MIFVVDFFPKGRNVVLEQSYGAPKVTKDGVTVAKSIEFKDRVKNVGASLVKQVANATNDIAGDGEVSYILSFTFLFHLVVAVCYTSIFQIYYVYYMKPFLISIFSFSGTTCATILTRAIYAEGCKSVAAGMNAMDLRRGITMAVDAVVTNLKSRARMISTSEEIAQVLLIKMI